MAFPSTAGSNPTTLANAWNSAMDIAGYIKTQSQTLRERSLAGPIGSSSILGYLTTLAEGRARLTAYAALPGLAAYAQAQVNDVGLDVAAEFSAMVAQMDATRDWVIGAFPASAGYLLAAQFAADGRTTDRQFSTAELAGLRTRLDALIAAIN